MVSGGDVSIAFFLFFLEAFLYFFIDFLFFRFVFTVFCGMRCWEYSFD